MMHATVQFSKMIVFHMENQCGERIHRKGKDLLSTFELALVVGCSLSLVFIWYLSIYAMIFQFVCRVFIGTKKCEGQEQFMVFWLHYTSKVFKGFKKLSKPLQD